MNHEQSTIRAIVRSLDGGEALVEVESGGCGRCHEKGGCGGQQLTQMFCGGAKTYRVDNPAGANVGDRVTIAIAEGSVRRTANLAYGIPLTAAIIGAAVGSSLGGDPGAILGAGFGLVLALLYVRFRSQRDARNITERPYIISRS